MIYQILHTALATRKTPCWGVLACLCLMFHFLPLTAQDPDPDPDPVPASPAIFIGGNVYGGGNEGTVAGNGAVTVKCGTYEGAIYGGGNLGELSGHSTVTIQGGDFRGALFGGARMADVGKYSYINIDGEHQLHDITANYVFGGNDISGVVGKYLFGGATEPSPFTPEINTRAAIVVDNTWQSYVLTTKERTTAVGSPGDDDYLPAPSEELHTFIGQLFGAGNGAYDYVLETNPASEYYNKYYVIRQSSGVTVTVVDAPLVAPTVARSYAQVNGGTLGYVFAGGNNATVTADAVISINNESSVTTETDALSIKDYTRMSEMGAGGMEHLSHPEVDERLKAMGINLFTFRNDHQILRVFGGNNQAEMKIMPKWNLLKGDIVNLYSGGNKGDMTYPNGLLMEIPASSEIRVANVYGGCRMADVRPKDSSGEDVTPTNLVGYNFPDGLSARVLVRGGDITNVYGGNDIAGKVWGGTAVGIYHSIHGDVYGGGNSSYAYTDNAEFKDDIIWGDFYYDVKEVLGDEAAAWTYAGSQSSKSMQELSVKALNSFRPNVEQVSLRLWAPDADHKTVIGGSVYVGGNCATLIKSGAAREMVHLKIGSYVIADKVFLGNNGEVMVDGSTNGILSRYADNTIFDADQVAHDFSSLDLTDTDIFAKYMEGVAMVKKADIVFDEWKEDGTGDPASYVPYSSYFGSFYCGGNVGSMTSEGITTINFQHPVVFYNKVVGGCNNAYVPVKEVEIDGVLTPVNALYRGGVIGTAAEQAVGGYTTNGEADGPIKDRLVLNMNGLRLQPMRWKVKRDASYEPLLDEDGHYIYQDAAGIDLPYEDLSNRVLEWNTIDAITGHDVPNGTGGTGTAVEDDWNRRLAGGNIYGGCYNSGHVNGNVTINILGNIIDRGTMFDSIVEEDEDGNATDDLYEMRDDYEITTRRSGVAFHKQATDPQGISLNVFGGGYGVDSEIWGSATVNITKGFAYQIFGGGENGAIGKGVLDPLTGEREYSYDARYSTYVNLHDPDVAGTRDNNVAEATFIYGGAFEGPIQGNTHVNLDNGRLYSTIAGSCNADIYGHTEIHVGVNGFPYLRDCIYGGNDLGGRILGTANFQDALREGTLEKVYCYDASGNPNPDVLNASAYIEYRKGHIKYIYGGHYGAYDYTDPEYAEYTYTTGGEGTTDENLGLARPGFTKPRLDNAFVNFRPENISNPDNGVERVLGGCEGYTGDSDRDIMQERSYVLIDIPSAMTTFQSMEVFGAGASSGLGMSKSPEDAKADPDKVTAVLDLVQGHIAAAYGGSYDEGVTRRTMVNVPRGSTIKLGSIFGGAYGNTTILPCDVYEAHVEYHSSEAWLMADNTNEYNRGAIFGGNNTERRTVYSYIDIDVPVRESHVEYGSTTATVYGAGNGLNTWSEYTQVTLHDGAQVYEVYGGGKDGRVLNSETVQAYRDRFGSLFSIPASAWALGPYYDPANSYATNALTNLANTDYVRRAEMDDRDTKTYSYNTNVIIEEGAYVGNYAYGGGLGSASLAHSGDVCGTTYIALLGGTVNKDLYAAGTTGGVKNRFCAADAFIASSNAYIESGKARNVYGGGWKGSVGHHYKMVGADDVDAAISDPYTNDVLGETHVVIGRLDGTSHTDGIPTIERNAYGGGEGGAVFGTTNITLNKGYIGYRFYKNQSDLETDPFDPSVTLTYIEVPGEGYYQEKIVDETHKVDGAYVPNTRLKDSGCVFGGGYIDNSSVDYSNVTIYGGQVRNSVFGGGEIAAIGRGMVDGTGPVRTLVGIYRAGRAYVRLFGGHVLRDVFGGGRGYNNLGESGTLYSDGFVFGKTEVDILGGEVGTDEGVALGYGNVFGGGDIGYVYSAYETASGGLAVGKKAGTRYDDSFEGRYYKNEGGTYVDGAYTGGRWVMDRGERVPTEDCKVLVEPWCQVTDAGGVTIGGETYAQGSYVPTDVLDQLQDKNTDATRWNKLDQRGIIIHNAIFAGGNTSSGSDKVYANTTTVFGNVSASIHDIYHRDLITIGTGHTGGLYGDGNLTFVDGYRGLNITSYGTDYYYIQKNITSEQYHALPDREAAYYEPKYRCQTSCEDKEGTVYAEGSTLTLDELSLLFAGVTASDPDTHETVNVLKPDGKPNEKFWSENGIVSRYAGRILNTIQRADFCGVFGSRMVMKGAQDRVPEVVDYTQYTINRVREVSLNKKTSEVGDPSDRLHGNYFGIYSVVNYLGSLTSDVNFGNASGTQGAERATESTEDIHQPEFAGQTYSQWKAKYWNDRRRNNGSCYNKLALASGVYLEIKDEKGELMDETLWGYITGVVELDLINVQPGIGGGFVYAKNEHGLRTTHPKYHTTLTQLNEGAVTRSIFTYTDDDDDTDKLQWETSGNFVHSTQTIIDDCYPITGKYKTHYAEPGGVPAHYWYIKGSVYVYDQYISAYTGAPNAYSEKVDIPLTISAASHGEMTLMLVEPNLYAYYSVKTEGTERILGPDDKMVINDVTYHLNDPITYWDWYMLSTADQNKFVRNTYVTIAECKIGDTVYPEGYVMLPATYEALRDSSPTVLKRDGDQWVENDDFTFDFVFRSSNNMSHDTGYMLTYHVNNPAIWDQWYSPKDGSSVADKISRAAYDALEYTDQLNYEDGPTFRPTTSGMYGQREYKLGDIISHDVYSVYQTAITAHPLSDASDQATFEEAYIVTGDVSVGSVDYYKGASIPKSVYDANTSVLSGHASPALVCTHTIQLTPTEYIYMNDRMTSADRDAYVTRFNQMIADTISVSPARAAEITDVSDLTDAELEGLTALRKSALSSLLSRRADVGTYVVPAYYCSAAGLYGGDYYSTGHNYRGLLAWSSLSTADRAHFQFNYDALDVLIDPLYGRNASGTVIHTEGHQYQYDSAAGDFAGAEANKAHYSLPQSVDYTATYNGAIEMPLSSAVSVTREGTPTSTSLLQKDDELTREVFESLPNEKRYYSKIIVPAARRIYTVNEQFEYAGEQYAVGTVLSSDVYASLSEGAKTHVDISYTETEDIYVVNEDFQRGESPYAVGTTISSETYHALSDDEKAYIQILHFDSDDDIRSYYYCRESYTIGEHGSGATVTNLLTDGTGDQVGKKVLVPEGTGTTYSLGMVPTGILIDETDYGSLVNKQIDFVIHGVAPEEVSTLYVTRESNIYDLSTEKIITVVYKYDYEESNADGSLITPFSERHVVNIHIQFKSGVPSVEDITAPSIVLPGTNVSLREPFVTPGAYEVTGGGWELFATKSDAESHINGIEYTPIADPLYWYQHGYYTAYYAKTYLGKTYSNAVPVSVANYHDLQDVMDNSNKSHHMYIDHHSVKRKPKIYINDYSASSLNGLDLLKDLFDLSHGKTLTGHAPLDDQVRDCDNLEFFLRANQSYTDDPAADDWTPIANGTGECFAGVLHGDGYTISGLDHSLFGHLCGDVYNLGVTGSFTSAGIADTGTGYVENCWVKSSATSGFPAGVRAVFGNPSRTEGGLLQISNCYYPVGNDYLVTTADAHGVATQRPLQAFYNGEVSYDLNGFYLYKRYNDHSGESATDYNYYDADDLDLEGNMTAKTGHYPSGFHRYVELLYGDGDFRYAGGFIPESENERLYNDSYIPIWPDDYLFFGQMLTYGHVPARVHQPLPTRINKTSASRLLTTAENNRVYRAPAYFRSANMGVAHFNPAAVFAKSKKDDPTTLAYKGMTAIDFTGCRETGYVSGRSTAAPYATMAEGKGAFYPPLLDDDGLLSFLNQDLTSNLLVYIPQPATTATTATHNVVTTYLTEPTYTETNASTYRTVANVTSSVLRGHPVRKDAEGTGYTAPLDHYLVDKEDFFAPIPYSFASGKRMWYQRDPAAYVDLDTGWEGISLPFTAELVTTQTKGELTHFYTGSTTGHEYWLRSYTDIGTPVAGVATANFTLPDASSGNTKDYTNTFLYDYYYSKDEGKDHHSDTYHQNYYATSHQYDDYPYSVAGVPYLVGFPGNRYYEFDLSGTFVPQNTYMDISALPNQIITFASEPGATIRQSDTELTPVTQGDYAFVPNYLSYKVAETPADDNELEAAKTYLLKSTGDSYVRLTITGETTEAERTVLPFRPYFAYTASGGSKKRLAETIIFSNEDYSFADDDDLEPQTRPQDEDLDTSGGALRVYGKRGAVVVESTLKEAADVRITNIGGVNVAVFRIEPGEIIETPVGAKGVYIVNSSVGRIHSKKLSIN